MEPSRPAPKTITKRIVEFYENRIQVKTDETMKWNSAIKEDFDTPGLIQADNTDIGKP